MGNIIYSIGLVCFASICNVLMGQPSYIYEGGNGSGYSSGEDQIEIVYQYAGGEGVGYAFEVDQIAILYQFAGGSSSGYTLKKKELLNAPFYEGGLDSGFTGVQILDDQNTNQFDGGSNDGYFQFEKCEDFIWTGDIGTGWLVTGNWNYDIIPDLKRKVIIPAGVPAFPSLNAGVFAIGENPSGGAFECGQLWIQEGAYLETKINNLVENYSIIKIDGTMQIKNSALNAFQNFSGGLIRITPTGLLLIQP